MRERERERGANLVPTNITFEIYDAKLKGLSVTFGL